MREQRYREVKQLSQVRAVTKWYSRDSNQSSLFSQPMLHAHPLQTDSEVWRGEIETAFLQPQAGGGNSLPTRQLRPKKDRFFPLHLLCVIIRGRWVSYISQEKKKEQSFAQADPAHGRIGKHVSFSLMFSKLSPSGSRGVDGVCDCGVMIHTP